VDDFALGAKIPHAKTPDSPPASASDPDFGVGGPGAGWDGWDGKSRGWAADMGKSEIVVASICQ
jgi:hypothetical protein